MNGLSPLIISFSALSPACMPCGRFLAKTWGIDPARKTPACEYEGRRIRQILKTGKIRMNRQNEKN